ncbi:M20/M25/M40 family metallo-hydrolase [Cupriavidus sp. IDO]|uniref:M20/M25/M40 family metallo-hydrolase n=1 Tax=Cupriavidus sp. IDO TaxID=1539142 RepID=UPI000B20D924|nr:M20/M25/M40 family metallo-hydrolase [Cupriavidus sp. IDO]
MRQICERVGATHGARIAIDYRPGYPSVVNTPAETDAAIAAAAQLVGADNVKTDIEPAMGPEDFAFMLALATARKTRRCAIPTTTSTTRSCHWARRTGSLVAQQLPAK